MANRLAHRPPRGRSWGVADTAPVMGDPGSTGRFGEFGGRYIPETLVMACAELDVAFREAWGDPGFRACHEDVGDFPEVDLPLKTIYTRIVSAFGAGLVGIL